MDDGTPICLAVTIDRRDSSAVFDFEGACGHRGGGSRVRWAGRWRFMQGGQAVAFHTRLPRPAPPSLPTGTGPQVFGNTNAPPAVTHSAIIYALRCMVTRDIPLNHGCMAPITVRIPAGAWNAHMLHLRLRPFACTAPAGRGAGRRPAAPAPRHRRLAAVAIARGGGGGRQRADQPEGDRRGAAGLQCRGSLAGKRGAGAALTGLRYGGGLACGSREGGRATWQAAPLCCSAPPSSVSSCPLHSSLQGCMNNFTFGDSGMGYYETVAGGAGAGPGWHGRRCARELPRARRACGKRHGWPAAPPFDWCPGSPLPPHCHAAGCTLT